jgi:uncharacterized protein YkwD
VWTALTHHRYRFLALAVAALLAAAAPAAAQTARHHPRHHSHRHSHRQSHPPAAPAASPAATTTVPNGPCANATTPALVAPVQEMRAAVECLINQQRARFHLPALTESSQLDQSAQNWTNLMVVKNIFTHGTDFANRISAAGYDWSNAGENIATGFATPQAVVTAWMESTDHCQNILSPQYANVGTGVNPNPVLAVATGDATWTQDFGLLMSANQPSANFGPANGCPYSAS